MWLCSQGSIQQSASMDRIWNKKRKRHTDSFDHSGLKMMPLTEATGDQEFNFRLLGSYEISITKCGLPYVKKLP